MLHLRQENRLIPRFIPNQRPLVFLTMIVKNEATNLPGCLDSVRDLVDEIVVVDTGSTDGNLDIATKRGARIVHFPWIDDFAAARNVAIDAARGEWIFWLDADERLGAEAREQLRKLFDGLKDENAAYFMRQRSRSADPMGGTSAVDQIRLFRNRPDVRWEYRLHEQILLSIRRTEATVIKTDVVIDHLGYDEPAARQQKLQRNTHILELAHAEKPDDPILAFHLACAYLPAGKPEKALPLLELCRQRLDPKVSIVPRIYRLLGQVLGHFGRAAEALEAFAAGRQHWPRDVELLLHQGHLFRKLKNYTAAEANFRSILALPPDNDMVGLDQGLRGYKSRNALAELLFEQGKLDGAETEWRAVVSEVPKFAPGWLGLAEIALAKNQRDQAAELLDHAAPSDPSTIQRANRLRQRMTETKWK